MPTDPRGDVKGFSGLESLLSEPSPIEPPPPATETPDTVPPTLSQPQPALEQVQGEPADSTQPVPVPTMGTESRKRLALVLLTAAVVCFTIIAIVAGTRDRDTTTEVAPQVGTSKLSADAEHRYCLAERFRLGTIRTLADEASLRARFDRALDDFNARCGSSRYRAAAVRRVLPQVKERESVLYAEAVERVDDWRREVQASMGELLRKTAAANPTAVRARPPESDNYQRRESFTKSAPTRSAQDSQGLVEVSATPVHARVTIYDAQGHARRIAGEDSAPTPVTLKADPGEYHLRISAEGCIPQTLVVAVSAGETARITGHLDCQVADETTISHQPRARYPVEKRSFPTSVRQPTAFPAPTQPVSLELYFNPPLEVGLLRITLDDKPWQLGRFKRGTVLRQVWEIQPGMHRLHVALQGPDGRVLGEHAWETEFYPASFWALKCRLDSGSTSPEFTLNRLRR